MSSFEDGAHARKARSIASILGISAALCVGAVGPVAAQTGGDGWQFEFTPYFWALGMEGDVQIGQTPTIGVDASFTDILDVLDFALMGALEARNDRWGILLDGVYGKLSDSATATRTGSGPVGESLTVGADATLELKILAAALAYRVSDGATMVDAIGGLRYTKVDVDAKVDASLFGPVGPGDQRVVPRKGSQSWTDPYIGVRLLHPVSDRWTLMGYLDAGGFDVGSKSTFQAIAGANYDFSKTMVGKFGFRYLTVDYDDGALYDMDITGLYVGVGFRF